MLDHAITRPKWFGAAFLLASALPAKASTATAWAASAKAGRVACIAAANLRHATVSASLRFSDQVGRDAMLVHGTYPQRFMKGVKGSMLCLYDRRSSRAEVAEAKGWSYR